VHFIVAAVRFDQGMHLFQHCCLFPHHTAIGRAIRRQAV